MLALVVYKEILLCCPDHYIVELCRYTALSTSFPGIQLFYQMYKSPKSAFEFGPRECMALLMWKSANLDKTQKCKRDNVWRWRSSNCFFLLMHIWKAWGILFLSQQNKCQMACFNWSIRSPTVVLSRHFHFPNTLSMNIWMANIQKLPRQFKVAYAHSLGYY